MGAVRGCNLLFPKKWTVFGLVVLILHIFIEYVTCKIVTYNFLHIYQQKVYAVGTRMYKAPEILSLKVDLKNGENALLQADVYSMSMVMWEIAHRCCHFFHGEPYIILSTCCNIIVQ